MLYRFDALEWTILGLFFQFCWIYVFMVRKRLRAQHDNNPAPPSHKTGLTEILSGLLLIIISVATQIYIILDSSKEPALLRPIAEMTWEPFIWFSIVFFLLGVTLMISGFLKRRIQGSGERKPISSLMET
jgi:hypothetical protein